MIDVNKLTSTLAKLSDKQLRDYGQQNIGDPYTIALISAEALRRKEVRDADQNAAQEQPKVVERMLAEVAPQQLPEDMGIGQLNAGEMNFAGGGIVAFADGGDVERYQFGGVTSDVQRILQKPPSQRTPQENALLQQAGVALQRPTIAPDSGIASADLFLSNLGPRIRNYFTEGASQLSNEELAARPNVGGVMNERILRSMGVDPAATRSDAPAQAARQQAEYIRQQDKLMKNHGPFRRPEEYEAEEASIAARAAKQAADKAKPAPAAGARKDTSPRPSSGAPTDKAAATKLPGTADLATLYQDILSKQNYQDPAAEASLQLEAQERASAAAERQAIARDAERFKDAYKGRESRLAESAAALTKRERANEGLAFLNAGLAIMSTPGGLATAIGKGAQVGTAQFAAGLDKIRSAQERLDEARDRLDDLKLNREETTAKELRAAENNYRRVGIEAQKRTIDGVRQAAGVNEARAKEIYGKTVGMAETVYKEEQANLRNKNSVAGMLAGRGDAGGTRADRLKLDSLKAMATNLSNELKDPFLGLPRNAEIKRAKQAELAQINAQLAQMSGLGTMLPASPAGAGSGVQFLGYE